MLAIQLHGPYRIIGYSYGATIAFEMATVLQKSYRSVYTDAELADPRTVNCLDLKNGFQEDRALTDSPKISDQPVHSLHIEQNGDLVGNLILLDGSHHYMKMYRNAYRAAYGVAAANLMNDALFESEALCGFALRFDPSLDYKMLRQQLLQMPRFEGRVDHVVSSVMATDLFKVRDTVEFAAVSLCRKMLAADRYEPSYKFEGNVTLIKAESGAAKEEDVGRDYGLSEVVNGIVDVHIVPGDHDTFIHGSSAQITADIIKRAIYK